MIIATLTVKLDGIQNSDFFMGFNMGKLTVHVYTPLTGTGYQGVAYQRVACVSIWVTIIEKYVVLKNYTSEFEHVIMIGWINRLTGEE